MENNFLPEKDSAEKASDGNKKKKFADGFTTFFHAVNSGDLVAIMAALKQSYLNTGTKAIIYQQINKKGGYYPGAKHPLADENGVMVTMTKKMFELLRPLIISQEYIADYIIFKGQDYEVDLNRIHDHGMFVNMPHGSINRWIFYAFPDMTTDLSKSWIDVPEIPNDRIIINMTQRYREDRVTYYFLRKYSSHLIFAGTEEERSDFCKAWDLNIPLLNVSNMLELASTIKGCRFFLGNSSLCWNIAEALKKPRILEACSFAENCIPVGEHAYDFYYQGGLTFAFEKLYELTKDSKGPSIPIMKGEEIPCPVCTVKNYSVFFKKGYNYCRCSVCQTLYTREINQANMVGGTNVEERSLNNPIIIKRLKDLGVKNCLDYGCGKGFLVKDANNAGLKMQGFDRFSKDFSAIPVEHIPFDCVTLVEVIEHMYAPFKELDEINFLLADGGLLYIETSFADFLGQPDEYVDPDKGHACMTSFYSMDKLMYNHEFDLKTIINRNVRVYAKKAK